MESSTLIVEVLPEVGGKIGQIRNRITGDEYLVPPQRPYRTIATSGDWLQHDISGMDDCFPNVAAGMYPVTPWSQLALPDLGEWTHGIWNVTRTNAREVTMERSGMTLPYFAVKTVRFLDEETLEFSYRVKNHGQSPMRYLWSAHPLIAVRGEYEILLPTGDKRLKTFPVDGESSSWPTWKGTDLSRDWLPDGKTLKVFVSELGEGWCTLRQPSHSLHFSFDVRELPALGLWFNNHGFPKDGEPFRCIAVEPCTSASDLLDELDESSYPVIPPDGTVQWSMRLRISAPPPSTETQEHQR